MPLIIIIEFRTIGSWQVADARLSEHLHENVPEGAYPQSPPPPPPCPLGLWDLTPNSYMALVAIHMLFTIILMRTLLW